MNTEYFKSFKKLSPDFFSIENQKEIIDIILPLVYNSCIDAKRKGEVAASPFRLV